VAIAHLRCLECHHSFAAPADGAKAVNCPICETPVPLPEVRRSVRRTRADVEEASLAQSKGVVIVAVLALLVALGGVGFLAWKVLETSPAPHEEHVQQNTATKAELPAQAEATSIERSNHSSPPPVKINRAQATGTRQEPPKKEPSLVVTSAPTSRLPEPPQADAIVQAGPVRSVAFSPDGKTVASASNPGTLILWDVASGKGVKELSAHQAGYNAVAFSPDGKTLAAGVALPWPPGTNPMDPNSRPLLPGEVQLWDMASGKLTAQFSTQCYVVAVAFSPDGKTVAALSGRVTPAPAGVGPLWCLSERLQLWDVATGNNSVTLNSSNSEVVDMAFHPDGKSVALTGTEDGKRRSIGLYNAASGQRMATFKAPGDIGAIAFSPDGKYLAAGLGSSVQLWDAASGQRAGLLQANSGLVMAVAFNPDSKRLASCLDDSSVVLWDVASGNALQTLTGHTDCVWSVAFSPDGKTLASGSCDASVKLWDVASGKCLQSFGK
jgi:WD40 repeat protein